MRVCIDPGHGGADPGAIGPTGLCEKAVNLAVANELRGMLQKASIHAMQTRSGDVSVSLLSRSDIANRWKADLFVSIHSNAAHQGAEGFEIWTTRGQTKADKVADKIFAAYAHAFDGLPGVRNTARPDYTDGDPDRESNFAVLRHTTAPAVLVELGFVSHPDTERRMRDPEWIHAAATGIAAGIYEWMIDDG